MRTGFWIRKWGMVLIHCPSLRKEPSNDIELQKMMGFVHISVTMKCIILWLTYVRSFSSSVAQQPASGPVPSSNSLLHIPLSVASLLYPHIINSNNESLLMSYHLSRGLSTGLLPLNFLSSTFSPYFSTIHSDYVNSPLSYELNVFHYIRSK